MESASQEILIQTCLRQIEDQLGWGSGTTWSTQDFDVLGQKILEKTHVQLSVVTLKRVWGRIRYESKPTVTTLNALAQFIGHENWQSFTQAGSTIALDATAPGPKLRHVSATREGRHRLSRVWFVSGITVLALASLVYFTAFRSTAPKPDINKFQFSSKKVVDVGVPNTVVFDYDASAASEDDSVFIQQSWDKRLSQQVSRDRRQHTSIYYHPGFFQAKLRINDEIVKTHDLMIQSIGWLPMIDTKPVPVYFKPADLRRDGSMGLTLDKIRTSNIALQPSTPWTCYYNVGDFGAIKSDDFVFETEFKNDYGEGAAACQHTQVHVLFEGAAMVIPFSIPGCVSELSFAEMNGKNVDLSPLGVDFSTWVNVKVAVRDTLVAVYVNHKKAFDLKVAIKPVRWVGLVYKFQGTGSVHFFRITGRNGDVLHEENFDLSSSAEPAQ